MEETINKVDINKEDTSQIPTEVMNEMDKEIFFTASMAKKKTSSVYKKKLEVSMLTIYQKINEAIAEGKYTINLNISSDEIGFLRNKNFRVITNSTLKMNGGETVYACTIYWN